MAKASKNGFKFRLGIGMADFIAGLMLVAGTIILVSGSVRPELAITPSINPERDIALLLAVPAVLAVIIGVGTRAERRCADDYAMQMLGTAAMVGMFTMILLNSVWAIDFLPQEIGIRGLRGSDMLGIGQIGWGACYAAFRIRGGVL